MLLRRVPDTKRFRLMNILLPTVVSFPLERASSAITKNEWITFTRIYKFLIEQYNLGNFVKSNPWWKLLEKVLGIGETNPPDVEHFCVVRCQNIW
ncbi:hypothetical protein BJV82DRAFT_610083 [Fennellomyces sp. T-0311]|nr:hypothetical protein BJV82DRAFT_610081 [Fennellomyces sp. T-0311]KAI8143972.1 hypothetical protein BJV82DRAFT_610083 [Fennellomyces sp. T-0311]